MLTRGLGFTWKVGGEMGHELQSKQMQHYPDITKAQKPRKSILPKKLESVESATYLGVNITSNLTWHKQIAKAIAKGNRSLGFIRRNIKTRSRKTKVRAYETLVRPILEYCSTVWDPHQNILVKDIERVQEGSKIHKTHVWSPSKRHSPINWP